MNIPALHGRHVSPAVLVLTLLASTTGAAELKLNKGDRICLVGNALGERMQWANDWETLLYSRFPDHQLVVRNLCFPGDEPFQRLRSLNFGSPDEHLAHSKADVILYFFGFNESFAGPLGIDKFSADLTRLVRETKTKDYSGNGPPRIVLISPIAYENPGDPNITDGKAINENLRLYTHAMAEVAKATGAGFVDLFTATEQLFRTERNLTINGFHLSDEGYKSLAPILDQGLFGSESAPAEFNARLKAEIDDKNFHWWHRYRAVNGYSIYGTRGEAGSDGTYRNRDVMERERAILDQMCANRDRRIWQLAQGKDVPDPVDDSNTLPFIQPKTNVDSPGNNPKLGTLDYIPAAEQQKLFRLPPGYEISLFASEEEFPELANPVAINFDNHGRLWVATMPSYPQWQPKTKLDDKLVILEDTDGDGRADTCQVFADGLHQPTGFELGHGGAFVAQQPDVLFLKDSTGDGRADIRVRKLIGFDSADSHHGLAAFEWGPDGALYFQEGTFKQSQVETPDGLVRLGDAGVWRYEPRTERFGVHVSLAFANPWGHVFDRWGQNFIADASPGFNYWAAPISGYIEYPDKHPGGSRDRHLDWGGSKSDKEYPVFIPKRIRPTSGCEIVSSRHFPPEAQGNFLVNNVIGDLAVLQHTVREDGSGFAGEEVTPLVLSEHGNFRPVDLQFAPDGSLYIVDWHNALIGHLQHNLREPNRDHSHGRIWRVTYKDRPLIDPPQIAGQPADALLPLLTEPEDRTRYRVRRELAEHDTDEVVAALDRWVAGLDPADADRELHLLEALWIHQTHNVVNEGLLRRLLESPEPRARAAATRVLCEWRDRVGSSFKLLEARIHDSHPRVRLEAVRACSYFAAPPRRDQAKAFELALDVLEHETDYNLDYTLDETLRALMDSHAMHASHTPNHAPHDHTHDHHDPAAHAHHAGHHHSVPAGPKPLLFLNKPPKIIAYQLARLTPTQLLAVERSPSDPKYKPVYEEILIRDGISRPDREEAVAAITGLNHSGAVGELLTAITRLDSSRPAHQAVAEQLAAMLLAQPVAALSEQGEKLRQAADSDNATARVVAHAALVTSGDAETAWSLAAKSPQARRDFLAGVRLVPIKATRAALRDRVVASMNESQPIAVRRAAVEALAFVPGNESETFQLVTRLIGSPQLRPAAVNTLLQIPKQNRPAAEAPWVVSTVVEYAESTPAARRTTDEFLDAMQLADELLALLPVDDSRAYRERLRAVAVRVVRINTVPEEMRYDTPYFAVEAGRPVQLVLRNPDLMPHNLVITAPGALRDVAQQAAGMPPQTDRRGMQYVPESANVMFATRMVDTRRQDVLTFTAPSEPGEYPYVCTFPNHWMRMYGVMVVVEDLDAWQADPQPPADPLGITREFVHNWSMDDFQADQLEKSLEGRQGEIGQRIYQEATCAQCHKLGGQGGAVGPDLSDVLTRWKGDHRAVLREILDPSYKVDVKYTLHNIVTADGRVISGIITDQDRQTITVISNPENPQPQVIPRDAIEEMIKSPTSLMPKGLMDRFTKDEILELMAYLAASQSSPTSAESADPR